MALIKPTILNIWLLVMAMNAGRFLKHNFLLLGRSSGEPLPNPDEFHVYTSHPLLDAVLLQEPYRSLLGMDLEPYRNHCLRVLSFAVYHRQQELAKDYRERQWAAANAKAAARKAQESAAESSEASSIPSDDAEKDSQEVDPLGPPEEVSEDDIALMAWALAYHDIALWTDGALSYLEPSVAVMEKDWAQRLLKPRVDGNKDSDSATSDVDDWVFRLLSDVNNLATVREIILQHHKIRSWIATLPSTVIDSTSRTKVDAGLVNAVRQADWADATMGVIRFGLPGTYLEAAYLAVPPVGFHRMLAGMGGRLSPNSLLGQLDVLQILKW